MKEKTNNSLILSTKVFTFFLVVCVWKYPFESCAFGNSFNTGSNVNGALGEHRGRLLKGGLAVERYAQERLVDILHDDEETIKDRLGELIQEEKRKKNVESILRNGKLRDEMTLNGKYGKGSSASRRHSKSKKKSNTVRFMDESSDTLSLSSGSDGSIDLLSLSSGTDGSTDSLSFTSETDSSTGSINGALDNEGSSETLSVRSDDDASTNSLNLQSDDDASTNSLNLQSDDDGSTNSLNLKSIKDGSTNSLDSLQLDDYLEKEFEDDLSDKETRESITLDDKYYEQDTITKKNEKLIKSRLKALKTGDYDNLGKENLDRRFVKDLEAFAMGKKMKRGSSAGGFLKKLDSKFELELLRFFKNKGLRANSSFSGRGITGKLLKIMDKYRVFAPLAGTGVLYVLAMVYVLYFMATPVMMSLTSIALIVTGVFIYAFIAMGVYYGSKIAKLSHMKNVIRMFSVVDKKSRHGGRRESSRHGSRRESSRHGSRRESSRHSSRRERSRY
ncbi:Plasmodium exported protein, unknown function [Plasmodium vivax]|uniref:Pv-fam-d protein n=1 Tax=Plasmodium vivax TaxID=5855 RepID=A0A1G4HB63_PLAVI|nr:Plasmodium exported protein, unknown function [Plasmodium vivax]